MKDKPANRKKAAVFSLGIMLLMFGITQNNVIADSSTKSLKVGQVLIFQGVDAAGTTYQEKWVVSGTARLPAATQKNYLLMEVSGDLDQGIFLLSWSKHNTEAYMYGGFGIEAIALPEGEVGTYWEYDEGGSRISAEIIETGVTVVVPSGSYSECVLVEKHNITGGSSSPPWFEYFKPGFFLVKWTDYYARENAPVEWELISVERHGD